MASPKKYDEISSLKKILFDQWKLKTDSTSNVYTSLEKGTGLSSVGVFTLQFPPSFLVHRAATQLLKYTRSFQKKYKIVSIKKISLYFTIQIPGSCKLLLKCLYFIANVYRCWDLSTIMTMSKTDNR